MLLAARRVHGRKALVAGRDGILYRADQPGPGLWEGDCGMHMWHAAKTVSAHKFFNAQVVAGDSGKTCMPCVYALVFFLLLVSWQWRASQLLLRSRDRKSVV